MAPCLRISPNNTWSDLVDELLVLAVAAQGATSAQVQVAANIGNHQMFVEQAIRKRAWVDEVLGQDFRRLDVDAHVRRPSEWVGRRVRRAPCGERGSRAPRR